ncbi:MAG: nucleotide exchange factor GrpE [Thermoleophilia bacterium]|nr:nucleotide exchange factor GrpE [Thermoleophilia bacterium]
MTTNKRHIPIKVPENGRVPENGKPAEDERNIQAGAPSAAEEPTRQPAEGAAGEARAASPGTVPGSPGTSSASSETSPASASPGIASGSSETAPVPEPESTEALLAERDALVAERDALLAEHQALVAERDALTDSFLRLRAEFDNFRKRMARELTESGARARAEVLLELLPVLDNLERALEAAEHHEEGKVIEGVKLTRDMFMDLLRRSGVEEVPGVGAEFDPNVHEALAVEPSEHKEGTVIRVFQRGYRHGDRILRPARVVVSAAPEAATEKAESPAS